MCIWCCCIRLLLPLSLRCIQLFGLMPVQLHGVRLSLTSAGTNLSHDPGGLLLSDLIFWSASNKAWVYNLLLVHTLPPEQLHQHRTPPASESARARKSLVAHQKTVCRPAARRESTDGTRAAHQRRLNPDLFLALRLPVNHCCSFQRGEWISSAPGTHRLILNCLADNFYIIAGC